jgi:nicotinate-nucleotide pyrophosphorylase (carboxylating)
MIGLPPAEADRIALVALTEDLAGGIDVTTRATIDEAAWATGQIVARADGVLAGLPVVEAVFRRCFADHSGATSSGTSSGTVTAAARDGDRVRRGQVIAEVTGPIRAILTGERSALNVLCMASGIATLTARWVDALAGTGAQVRDTRKTAPGLRAVQKYAVRCGGGLNHRMALSDQALIKDNHVLAAGGVVPALNAVRALAPDIACEVECTLPEQVEQACAAGAELILLDNMTLEAMRASVQIARRYGTKTEASGGLRLENARDVAQTGVDYLAVGALTHSAPTLDIALDLVGSPTAASP